MENVQHYMATVGEQARAAGRIMAQATTANKNATLLAIAQRLDQSRAALLAANEKDLGTARANGLDEAMLDRLTLNNERINGMITGLQQVASLPDPVGTIDDLKYVPSGIQVGKMRVPLGVVGIIYESRPNVTVEAASLALKSGNAVILRGGSEAIHSNTAIAACVQQGLAESGLPATAVQVIETVDRAAVGMMLTMSDCIDVIIPRGGRGLIERVSAEARIPVIKHLDGVCHVYIDDRADLGKAVKIAINAKTHRYGVCNAMETLLVHEAVAAQVLPILQAAYLEKGVELRGCGKSQSLMPGIQRATEADWSEEYLAPVLAMKVVDDMGAAIDHINRYGSHHTDAIVTEDFVRARAFLSQVDSSSVMVNASTRFADGFEYGLGAEIGISTDKIHARGPVGLEGLTSQKYVVLGDGHVRV